MAAPLRGVRARAALAGARRHARPTLRGRVCVARAADEAGAPAAEAAAAPSDAPAPAQAPPPAEAPAEAPPAYTPEQIAKCQEVEGYIQKLEQRRQMKFNELRLVISIEDPRAAEQRELYGIETNSRGVSKKELVQALVDVNEGRVPGDELALDELLATLRSWPYLEDDEYNAAPADRSDNPYAAVTDVGLPEGAEGGGDGPLKPLRDAFGYTFPYMVMAVPVVITVSVLTLLFVTSLQ